MKEGETGEKDENGESVWQRKKKKEENRKGERKCETGNRKSGDETVRERRKEGKLGQVKEGENWRRE